MKWISFFVLLMLTASPALGRTRGYMSYATRIRYSPYAFGIHHSGLIPARIHYSPYAFGVGHSGLISDYIVYSPYAFGVRHSGLVSQWGIHRLPLVAWCEEGRRGRGQIVGPTGSQQAQARRPTHHRRVSRGPAPRKRTGRGADVASRIEHVTIARNCPDKVIPGRYWIKRCLWTVAETVHLAGPLTPSG